MNPHEMHRLRLSLIRPYLLRLSLGFTMMLIGVLILLCIPKAVAYFIDNAAQAQHDGWLSWIALLMVVVLVVHAAVTSLRYYLFESAGILIVTRLRQQLYRAIISQGIGFFDHNHSGNLSNRLSADVEVLKDTLTMVLAIALRSLLTCIGGSVLLLTLSPQLSLLMLVVLPLSILAARQAGRLVSDRSREVQENLAQCNHIAQESFANIRLVHAFEQQRGASARYEQATDQARALSLRNTRIFAGFQGVTGLIQYMALLVTLWFGGQMVLEGTLTIGELTSFILYAAMVATSASGVTWFWGEWMKAVGATERVFELLAMQPSPTASLSPPPLTKQCGEIVFEHVSFSYPSRPDVLALESFSLRIEAGEKIALVGHSGAGKSTLANLLLGFYSPQQGRISFNGIDTQQMGVSSIRRTIAIVDQEPCMFSGTIRENIQYALPDRTASLEEVIRAAKHANADDFIRQLPDGYETQLGDRGLQLSGGQKQRIAIARAILRDARILILDEATSALDAQSERQVKQALENLMLGRTTIMITHRLATLSQAQRIIVMQQGRIVETGNHRTLMQSSVGVYRALINEQQYQSQQELPVSASST